MQFKDVIGQKEIKRRLIESAKENRVSHALLFSGKEGSGKLPMAIAFAQYLNCKNRTETDSCGVCSSCIKYNKLIHPDLHFSFPYIRKDDETNSDVYINEWRKHVLSNPYFNIKSWNKALKVENSQTLITVKESEQIIRKLNLKIFEAEYKVVIIWMIERMNNECSNKLLKIFEEPPPRTLFIMIAENEDLLLSTIRSRAQLVKFTGIDNESMTEALRKLPETENKNIQGLVHLAGGNYVSALEILSPDEETVFNSEAFSKMMRICYKKAWEDVFSWIDNIAATGRERQKSFILYSLRMIRENFIFNLKQPEIVFLTPEEKGFSERFSPFINERNIISFTEEFEKAFFDISRNGNSKIIFCDLLLKTIKLLRA